jgi:hypothetical protein
MPNVVSSLSSTNLKRPRTHLDYFGVMQAKEYRMVRTRGIRGRGVSSQAPPTPPVPPPPSPELALILRSLEAINETLKGRQPTGTEVEPPSSGTGNPEASRDLGGGPPPEDITLELQKIKQSEFVGGHASECVEAWLEGMTRCFALRDYASNSKAKIAIF